jgi:hypothetical protein
MLKSLILIPISLLLTFGTPDPPSSSRCSDTDRGPAIDWSPGVKLEWSDFRSRRRSSKDFSIAASTCGFGYDGIMRGNKIEVNVFVRFYCEESWRDPKYDRQDVLDHEQLHFDICELYGRKFYRAIVGLREQGRLNEKNLNRLYNSLVEEYDHFQDIYDLETNHSTVAGAQQQWNRRIRVELGMLAPYADYREF